jgi:hypothetical protein
MTVTVIDASLALARRKRLPLATLDAELIKAAAAEKVPVFGESCPSSFPAQMPEPRHHRGRRD